MFGGMLVLISAPSRGTLPGYRPGTLAVLPLGRTDTRLLALRAPWAAERQRPEDRPPIAQDAGISFLGKFRWKNCRPSGTRRVESVIRSCAALLIRQRLPQGPDSPLTTPQSCLLCSEHTQTAWWAIEPWMKPHNMLYLFVTGVSVR